MRDPVKKEHLSPLLQIRQGLVIARRKAAYENDLSGLLDKQEAIDLVDRAIVDETRSPLGSLAQSPWRNFVTTSLRSLPAGKFAAMGWQERPTPRVIRRSQIPSRQPNTFGNKVIRLRSAFLNSMAVPEC